MKILWVEDGGGDFEAGRLTKVMFEKILPKETIEGFDRDEEFHDEFTRAIDVYRLQGGRHEIVLCRSFDDWCDMVAVDRVDFDVALLDINLEAYSVDEPPLATDHFLQRAGLYIYHQLRGAHGMPAENIAFFSGQSVTMKDFYKICAEAMLPLRSQTFEKKHGDLSRVSQWLATFANSSYHQLRRATLDSLAQVKYQVEQSSSTNLPEHFPAFRPADPGLWDQREAYIAAVERYSARVGAALPLVEPDELVSTYQAFARELTSPWQGHRTALESRQTQASMATADRYLIRNGGRILSIAHDWAMRGYLSDQMDTEHASYLTLLALRSLMPHRVIEPSTNELILLELIGTAEDGSWLNEQLESEFDVVLKQGLRQLSRDFPPLPQSLHKDEFLQVCSELVDAVNNSGEASYHALLIEESLDLLYRCFWYALTMASVEKTVFPEIHDLQSGGVAEHLGRRLYKKVFGDAS
ncbi:MAG: hypothetical protein AAF772_04885 [Acidobacteriota bacterium]